jgi:hypothetical protein
MAVECRPIMVFAVANFRMETLLQVKGENALYVNIQDKGPPGIVPGPIGSWKIGIA